MYYYSLKNNDFHNIIANAQGLSNYELHDITSSFLSILFHEKLLNILTYQMVFLETTNRRNWNTSYSTMIIYSFTNDIKCLIIVSQMENCSDEVASFGVTPVAQATLSQFLMIFIFHQ